MRITLEERYALRALISTLVRGRAPASLGDLSALPGDPHTSTLRKILPEMGIHAATGEKIKMGRRKIAPQHQIETDGKTIWINGPDVCLGRFSRTGVDVHGNAEEQMEMGIACKDCSSTPDWKQFVDSMMEHHGISVASKYRPLWTWSPQEWAREYCKVYGRTKLRAALERLERQGNPWGGNISLAWEIL
jgi:hypothetical protein